MSKVRWVYRVVIATTISYRKNYTGVLLNHFTMDWKKLMRGFLNKLDIRHLTSRPLDFQLKWLATGVLILSAILTSGNWLYPVNVILLFLGNILWAIVGWMWKETSLVVLSVLLSVIYAGGMLLKYMGY